MEEDKKKKKKNKKKKNKQTTKPTECATVDAIESTSDNQSYVSEMGPDNCGHVLETSELQNAVVRKIDTDMDRSLANGTGGPILVEAGERYWLDMEASLQEKIKQLRAEKDASIQKEVILEENIKRSLKERDEYLEKEAGQEEKIIQLRNERNACMQKEDGLEEKIKQLEKEKDAYLQREADLKRIILQLESEKDIGLKKEVGFEERIVQLENEVALLNLKGASLDERIEHVKRERDSWVQKQNSTEEAVASLENVNTKLRAEVVELEESRRSLLQENNLLTQNISSLQSQIFKLDSSAAFSHTSVENKITISENGDADPQIEAAYPLVEKLMRENAELVEKVNELYYELERRGAEMEVYSSVGSDPMDAIPLSANVPNISGPLPDPADEAALPARASESMESLEDVIIKDTRKGKDVNPQDVNPLTSPSDLECDEIVQIPLDENEVTATSALESAENDDKSDIPLSDAPLVGAPFRFISFVARYVSGADLVNNNAGSSVS